MAVNQNEGTEVRSLENLGISESEERIYRWLLKHPAASTSEAAHALTLTPGKGQRLLESIESKGLATHTPERPRRYIASSPDVALGAIFLQRQKALLNAQRAIQELQEQANVVRRSEERGQMVELIPSREAERFILEQMQDTAQEEIVALVRSPARILRPDEPVEQEHEVQRKAQARGLRYRSVVDVELMGLPSFLTGMRSDMEAGEEVRVLSNLPLKLVLADHRLALIPLSLKDLNGPALLVRSSALLDALYELFEMFWAQAAPISFTQANEPKFDEPELQLNEELKELITLLASGLNDKNIAYDLGVSKRTFERRIAELMQALSARTRFQVGWLAALRLSGKGAGTQPRNAANPKRAR